MQKYCQSIHIYFWILNTYLNRKNITLWLKKYILSYIGRVINNKIRWEKDKLFFYKYLWISCKYFPAHEYYSYYNCKFWNLQIIPIKISKNVGSTNLFIFLCVGQEKETTLLNTGLINWYIGILVRTVAERARQTDMAVYRLNLPRGRLAIVNS